jgi:uncharacterized membrane protein YdjX (TVP38/TMEM64 family)
VTEGLTSFLPIQQATIPGLAFLAAAFVAGALLFIPRPPLCVAGGILFGLSAFPVALVSSTVGAILAFLISRYLFRSSFLKAINRRPKSKWRAIKDAVDIEGWRIVGLLRLASPVPGTATNYLFGLTRISLWQYTAATIAGLMPQTFLFVYLGTTGNAALRAESWFKFGVMLASVGFALAVCWLIAQRTRAILADRAIEPLH